jgi:hypothetical protein
MTQDLLQKHAQNLMIVTGLGQNIPELQIESSLANLYVGNFRDGFRDFLDAKEYLIDSKDKSFSDARKLISLFMEGKTIIKDNGEIESGIDYLTYKKPLLNEKIAGNFKQGSNTITSKSIFLINYYSKNFFRKRKCYRSKYIKIIIIKS